MFYLLAFILGIHSLCVVIFVSEYSKVVARNAKDTFLHDFLVYSSEANVDLVERGSRTNCG